MCIAKNAIRSTNLIINQFGLFFKERDPRILLVLNDLQNHLIKALDHFRLFFAQGRLIGDLEDIPKCFRPFPIQTSDRQTKFIDRLHDLIDLVAQYMPGRCTMAEPRIAVPTFVGQAVR